MHNDSEAAEYELTVLLEEIEKEARHSEDASNFASHIVAIFNRARMNGVVRYPVPS